MDRPTKLFSYRVDDADGEAYTKFAIYNVPKEWGDEAVTAWVRYAFPEERCRHSHDCCGQYYPRLADWSKVRGGEYFADSYEVLVRQRHICNV